MQWCVPVARLLRQLLFQLFVLLAFCCQCCRVYAYPFVQGMQPIDFAPVKQVSKGAVYAREVILGENDAPILVEFDLEGKEVKTIGEQQGEYADTRIMSGVTFNSFLKQKQLIEKQYINQFKVLSREQYESETTRIVDHEGNSRLKKALKDDTLFVWLLKPEFIIGNNKYILLEIPISTYEVPVTQSPAGYIRSVLVSTKTGRILYRSENNIGVRTGFILDNNNEVKKFRDREATDTVLNPIANAKVFAVADGRDFITFTDGQGKYRVEYYNPPCPGFEFLYHNPIIAELHYSRFHPRKTEYLPYFLIRQQEHYCNGLYVWSPEGLC
ncbi:hypothetical protein [Zooshikella ganghwensis]|uniref:hypothetical protein n=1 Tax=Zooshikella ganghwensis TaxID=202772 RepID=UPI0003FBAF77|nr:hypothetical protein [Zooshikella ganghwensis]